MNDTLLAHEFMHILQHWGRISFSSNFLNSLTKGEFYVLQLLRRNAAFCPTKGITVSSLAGFMKVSPPAISRMVKNLEEKGFLTRTIDPADRRNTLILITPKGECIVDEQSAKLDDFMRNVVTQMGDEQTRQLIFLLKRLRSIMDAQESITCIPGYEDPLP